MSIFESVRFAVECVGWLLITLCVWASWCGQHGKGYRRRTLFGCGYMVIDRKVAPRLYTNMVHLGWTYWERGDRAWVLLYPAWLKRRASAWRAR